MLCDCHKNVSIMELNTGGYVCLYYIQKEKKHIHQVEYEYLSVSLSWWLSLLIVICSKTFMFPLNAHKEKRKTFILVSRLG